MARGWENTERIKERGGVASPADDNSGTASKNEKNVMLKDAKQSTDRRSTNISTECSRKFMLDAVSRALKKAGEDNDNMLIFVDEVNDPGKVLTKRKKKSATKTFGYGVAMVKDTDQGSFKTISESWKTLKGIDGEFKLRDIKDVEDKVLIAECIGLTETKTFGYYIDKTEDVPEGFEDQGGTDVMIGMLHKMLDMVISDARSENVTVVVDDHSSYHDGEADSVRALSKLLSTDHNRNVSIRTGGKKNDEYSLHLQTTDAVSHALHRKVEFGYSDMADAMKQIIIKLDKGYNIRRR